MAEQNSKSRHQTKGQNPLDFFQLQALLTPEQQLIRASVRDFISHEAEPLVRKAYREEKFPSSLAPKMGELGLFGSNLSGYGLPGLDAISYGLMMQELERCDSGLRSFASVQGALVMYPIHAYGSEEQKQQWLPDLASGKRIGCFGLTESEGGSDPAAMRTIARSSAEGWTLTGSKMWITNGSAADVAVIWAKTESEIRGFLVPTSTPGFRSTLIQGKLSLRASVTSELYLDEVRVPHSAVLPKAIGLKAALSCLSQARYGIAWGVVGAAEACFEEALRHAQTRILFGRPLASFQLAQRKLALMATKITQAQLLAYRLGQLKAAGQVQPAQISMAKQANVESALEIARTARDILGASGISDEYRTMRHMCNLETVFTYEGTNDVHLLIVGKELTGFAAFS